MERYRITPEAAVYFITYSVVEWLPVFIRAATCKIVTESLAFCHREKHLRINAFVIMPTHLHLIVFDDSFAAKRLEATLADFRKYTGRQMCDYCEAHLPGCFPKTLREQAVADRQRRFWQPSRHPEAVQNEAFWQQKVDYIHNNPCRSGLVLAAEHWRFSSARWYLSDGKVAVDVPLTPIVW
jgi:REP element-mobilizing transposase RayT